MENKRLLSFDNECKIYMDYSNYSISDFIMDESFQAWVHKPADEQNIFWENYLASHPEKFGEITEAKNILSQLSSEPDTLPVYKVNNIWKNIFSAITEREPVSIKQYSAIVKEKPVYKWWMVAAASISLLIVGLGSYLYYDYNKNVHYATNFGQTLKVNLPDGSLVVLNANSKLSYPKNWESQSDRTVYLEGEAFFDVTEKPLSSQAKFIVKTEALNVEVLGTQFNVAKRECQTEVTLNRGKIKIDLKESTKYSEEDLTLKPGERAEVKTRDENLKMTKIRVNPLNYSSWINNHWLLENTSLNEVAERIENTFGIKVIIENAEIKTESMTGVLPTNDINHLLEVLSITYGVKINVKNNQILINK